MTRSKTEGLSYYDFLGVAENATQDEIRRAYRRLAEKFHPDHNSAHKAWAEIQFKLLQQAYDVLRDPLSKREYDRIRTERRSPGFSQAASFDSPTHAADASGPTDPYAAATDRRQDGAAGMDRAGRPIRRVILNAFWETIGFGLGVAILTLVESAVFASVFDTPWGATFGTLFGGWILPGAIGVAAGTAYNLRSLRGGGRTWDEEYLGWLGWLYAVMLLLGIYILSVNGPLSGLAVIPPVLMLGAHLFRLALGPPH